MLAAVAVTAFALGLIELNAYLLKYGVSDFNVLRPRYVTIGMVSLLFISISTVLPLIAAHEIATAIRKGEPFLVFLMLLYGAVLVAILPVPYMNSLEYPLDPACWDELGAFLLGCAAVAAIRPWTSDDGSIFKTDFKYSYPRWAGGSLVG